MEVRSWPLTAHEGHLGALDSASIETNIDAVTVIFSWMCLISSTSPRWHLRRLWIGPLGGAWKCDNKASAIVALLPYVGHGVEGGLILYLYPVN